MDFLPDAGNSSNSSYIGTALDDVSSSAPAPPDANKGFSDNEDDLIQLHPPSAFESPQLADSIAAAKVPTATAAETEINRINPVIDHQMPSFDSPSQSCIPSPPTRQAMNDAEDDTLIISQSKAHPIAPISDVLIPETSDTPQRPFGGAVGALKFSDQSPVTSPVNTAKAPVTRVLEYRVKRITFNDSTVPIIMENENGPCPMIAIANVLLLQRKLSLPSSDVLVSSDRIINALSDQLVSISSGIAESCQRSDEENKLSTALSVFPNLETGMEMNIQFNGVANFGYTPLMAVFNLFKIPIYHGWVVDPQDRQEVLALGNLTYSQAIETINNCKSSSNSDKVLLGQSVEAFLERTSSQLTIHGLCQLAETLQEGQLAVIVFKNQFNTILKKGDHIFTLLTKRQYANEPSFVWSTLTGVGVVEPQFVDGHFRLRPEILSPADPSICPPPADGSPDQIDMDHKLAMSLEAADREDTQTQRDLDLAKSLQAIEDEKMCQRRSRGQVSRQKSARVSTHQEASAEGNPHHHHLFHRRRRQSAPQEGPNESHPSAKQCLIS